jgi:hypothetical protein
LPGAQSNKTFFCNLRILVLSRVLDEAGKACQGKTP